MKYPDNITTKKARFAYWFFINLYYLENGKSQIVDRIMNWVTQIVVLFGGLKLFFGISFPMIGYGLMILLAVFACYIIGRLYSGKSIDYIQNQVNMERNPVMKDLHKLCKEKDKL